MQAAHAEIETYRLARAVHMEVEPTGYGRTFSISERPGGMTWIVNLDAPGRCTVTCTCRDYHPKRPNCAHVLAARLYGGDPVVLRALRFFIPLPRRAGAPTLQPQAIGA